MIKLMYVNGDSFSFGEELDPESNSKTRLVFTEHKRKYCYSGIIADTCNIPNYINNSLPGGSNERVYRTLITDISRLLQTYKPEEIFVTVSLTTPYRREFAYGNDDKSYYDFLSVHPPPDSGSNLLYNLWKILVSHYNTDYGTHYFDVMMQLAIQNFLRANKIPYLLTKSIENHNDRLVYEKCVNWELLTQFNMLRYYNEISFLTFNEIHDLPKGPGYHPLADSHKLWAEYLLKMINERNLFEREDL